jgi:acetyl-CoA acetyltransferase
LVGFGHPVGATGVKQLLEISANPEYGIAANMGGDDKTAVVSIIKNC